MITRHLSKRKRSHVAVVLWAELSLKRMSFIAQFRRDRSTTIARLEIKMWVWDKNCTLIATCRLWPRVLWANSHPKCLFICLNSIKLTKLRIMSTSSPTDCPFQRWIQTVRNRVCKSIWIQLSHLRFQSQGPSRKWLLIFLQARIEWWGPNQLRKFWVNHHQLKKLLGHSLLKISSTVRRRHHPQFDHQNRTHLNEL